MEFDKLYEKMVDEEDFGSELADIEAEVLLLGVGLERHHPGFCRTRLFCHSSIKLVTVSS
jgi:hypothetical protein